MWNIFSDLDRLGITGLENVNLFEEEEHTEKIRKGEAVPVVHTEEEFIFDKKYKCPVCGKEFTSKTVRTGKLKLMDSDSDLKPNYMYMDPMKYDVVACPHCGYAALTRNYGHITPTQIKTTRERIAANFTGMKESGETHYTIEDAENRYKLALANAVVVQMKNSDRAYICLKLGWVFRSEKKRLMADNESGKNDKRIAELYDREKDCIKMAYDGFTRSYSSEIPPICGMDSNTLAYLLADLARQVGDYENAVKYIGSVLYSKTASARVKDKARTEKDLIFKEMQAMS